MLPFMCRAGTVLNPGLRRRDAFRADGRGLPSRRWLRRVCDLAPRSIMYIIVAIVMLLFSRAAS
ncbi:hypothetical protein KCP69_22715 [Salmonella enterica subsp. enterica]|nr:hypothetical protein KCP69_22715 [Salmonella enterica subsp. enterica]